MDQILAILFTSKIPIRASDGSSGGRICCSRLEFSPQHPGKVDRTGDSSKLSSDLYMYQTLHNSHHNYKKQKKTHPSRVFLN